VFVALGVTALTAAVMLGFAIPGGGWFAVLTLWFLPVGTLFSVIELILLAFFLERHSVSPPPLPGAKPRQAICRLGAVPAP
jgi:hypothetical protein